MNKGVVFSDKPAISKEDSKSGVLRAVRANCVECAGDSSEEVKYCPATTCLLWPYRFGKTPRQVREKELLDPANFDDQGRFHPEKETRQCAA